MTVFVAHAPADRATAEALEAVLERRGQFVELDDGQTALRPVQAGDVLVLLLSPALVHATARLRLEQRALDAWADGRLVLLRLEVGDAPVGLRDLPAIEALEGDREAALNEVAERTRDILERRAGHTPVGPTQAKSQVRRPWLVPILLMLPGIAALVTIAAIWLVNRIGPTPGGWLELRGGLENVGGRIGLPAGVAPFAFGLAVVVMLAGAGWLVARAFARPATATEAVEPEPIEKPPSSTSDILFVSYARANETSVLPMIANAKKAGRKFWLDQQAGVLREGWAGEVVRAIGGAAGVVVMCSKAAFESDHVKREIYLADRYRKRLLPVFLEDAQPPEDFEYFFVGAQPVKLFETPEAERQQALVQVLGTA